MRYIYKLIDATTLEELNKSGAITLSRPFMHFHTETKGFKIFYQIMDKLKNSNLSVDELSADTKLIKSASKWVEGYKNSLPAELKTQHPSDFTEDEYLLLCVKSDIEIAMSTYFRTYCGYFTSACLEEESTRLEYLNNNNRLVQGKEYYVKVPIEQNHFDLYATSWKRSVNNENYYNYHKELTPEGICSEDAVLHIHGIEYVSVNDLKLPWNHFNGYDNRRVSSLLKYVDEQYYTQDEQRLMLHIPKTTTHSIVENKCSNDSTGESMIKKICNICLQALQYPKYVYLMVDGYEVFKIPDSELKH